MGKYFLFSLSSYSYEIMEIFSFVLGTILSFIIVFACWTCSASPVFISISLLRLISVSILIWLLLVRFSYCTVFTDDDILFLFLCLCDTLHANKEHYFKENTLTDNQCCRGVCVSTWVSQKQEGQGHERGENVSKHCSFGCALDFNGQVLSRSSLCLNFSQGPVLLHCVCKSLWTTHQELLCQGIFTCCVSSLSQPQSLPNSIPVTVD